jgi:EAL domain-containing protein (putative c-di-GMP-specific phosphodiesterase class I)
VHQPVVDLNSGEVLGYEALARGPRGSRFERPDQLFGAAREQGRLLDLEWACRIAALETTIAAGLSPPLSLFVNVEVDALDAPLPEELAELMRTAPQQLNVVVELTERDLGKDPAMLLAKVQEMRELGCRIAVDDVGSHPESLALMPFLEPDVIKLDISVIQDAGPHIAPVANAVDAEAERSGAVVLAEGIETAEHLAVAKALGATVGQGWLFGRPEPLPVPPPAAPAAPLGRVWREHVDLSGTTPYELVTARRPLREGPKEAMVAISRRIESQAALQDGGAVMIASFQDARYFTPATAAHYARLAERLQFVGAMGVDLPFEPAPGVRGAALAADEPLVGEWNVAVVAPHFAAALVARDLGDTGVPDMERRFEFAVTFDRDLAVSAASALLSRIARR